MTGKKIKSKKMGIFVSMLQHNSDKKTVTENKIQNNVRQYKVGEFSCDITKYDFWICGVLQVFPLFFDHLSITRYNKLCQIRDLSFRGSTALSGTRTNSAGESHCYNCGKEGH